MNKETIKGLLILAGVVAALGLFAVVATENGWHVLGCYVRAMLHGVALSNIRAICA